jgi:DNA-binding response OmpR family regulator
MNKARELRALVVDDEAAVRELIVRYLSEQGFECETAGDGNQAEERLAKVHYDVVITDLRMPNKHGHALAVHLLALKTRPVIVVHTSVIEPKLAKDLLARGVDDIVFKPIDLSLLAVKVSALVARRDARHDIMQNGTEATEDEMPSQLLEDTAADKPVSLAQVE